MQCHWDMDSKFRTVPGDLSRTGVPLLPPERPKPRGGRPRVPDRVVLAGILYRLRTGCQWKALPSEFGSSSTCHLTDGRGVPLAAVLGPANVHDKWTLAETLESVVLRAPRGPRRPEHLCLDKGWIGCRAGADSTQGCGR